MPLNCLSNTPRLNLFFFHIGKEKNRIIDNLRNGFMYVVYNVLYKHFHYSFKGSKKLKIRSDIYVMGISNSR